MKNDVMFNCVTAFIVILFFACAVFVIKGPANIYRSWNNYTANWAGSSWLVIQYNQAGGIIAHWELDDVAISSEAGSDGIYFVDNDSNVVHLSGHYVYVQTASYDLDKLKKTFGVE
jgi:hypothetical protein